MFAAINCHSLRNNYRRQKWQNHTWQVTQPTLGKAAPNGWRRDAQVSWQPTTSCK